MYWPDVQIANLQRVIKEIDGGKLQQLLDEPTHVQVLNIFIIFLKKVNIMLDGTDKIIMGLLNTFHGKL